MAITDGIVGCWTPSLGASGYRLLDKSGRGNHGTLTNMTSDDWTGVSIRGVSGRALDYDGSNDFVNLGIPVISGAASRTISVWARFRTVATGGVNRILYSQGTAATNNSQFAFGQNGIGGTWYFQGFANNFSFGLGDTLWHHHAVTYNGTAVSWFIDGVLQTTSSRTLSTNAGGHAIGYNTAQGGNFFDGQVAELAIYNQAATPADALELYRRGEGVIGRQFTGQIRRRVFGFVPPTFRAAWARQRAGLVGGGVR